MPSLVVDKKVSKENQGKASDLLAESTNLSKSAIKLAMQCGAVWYRKKKGKTRRIRRATFQVYAGDRLTLYYDESILLRKAPIAHCEKDFQHYSIWYKPPGLLTQGTRFGDHCALTRQAEKYFKPPRSIYVVHRLDRETAGLSILGHSRSAAHRLSELFQHKKIVKLYGAWVKGRLSPPGGRGEINLPLDGRCAMTRYRVIDYDAEKDQSRIIVTLVTGRTHQIRRHFAMTGYPVVGDPRYGRGNKNSSGLMLVAQALKFECPFGNGRIKVEVNPSLSNAIR